jgi:2'-5' RNA ligase
MRLFVAIKFDSEMKNEIIRQREFLRSKAICGNFTRDENIHLTLAFIGEYDDLSAVKAALDEVKANEFDLTLCGGGNFGSLYWVGTEKEPALDMLVSNVRSCLEKRKIPFDRKPFSSHITISRQTETGLRITLSPKRVKTRVGKISLMRSDRINGRLTYTEIYGIPLE